MTRENKFRAWDKENDRMLFPDDTDDILFEITIDGIKTIDMNGNEDLYAGLPYLDAVIMQYTGLKDKNGVEIYEGDILMAGDAYLGVIEYHSKRAQFIGRNIGDSFQEDEYDTLYTKNGRFNSAEVIGNIYENSNFLEEAE